MLRQKWDCGIGDKNQITKAARPNQTMRSNLSMKQKHILSHIVDLKVANLILKIPIIWSVHKKLMTETKLFRKRKGYLSILGTIFHKNLVDTIIKLLLLWVTFRQIWELTLMNFRKNFHSSWLLSLLFLPFSITCSKGLIFFKGTPILIKRDIISKDKSHMGIDLDEMSKIGTKSKSKTQINFTFLTRGKRTTT